MALQQQQAVVMQTLSTAIATFAVHTRVAPEITVGG
jgi:hypothetical protein